ncbi:hypothetical protein, partial [Streptomyces hokutonensis]|uniref:hypothetical protein n=1 Tax=Streptomyces hokutonensis TaxID=1306990 RepID=UPI0036C49EB8
ALPPAAEYSLRSFRASPREFPPPAGRYGISLREFHNVHSSGMKREWEDWRSSGTENIANWRASGTERSLFCLRVKANLTESAFYPFPWVDVGGISDSFKGDLFDWNPRNK